YAPRRRTPAGGESAPAPLRRASEHVEVTPDRRQRVVDLVGGGEGQAGDGAERFGRPLRLLGAPPLGDILVGHHDPDLAPAPEARGAHREPATALGDLRREGVASALEHGADAGGSRAGRRRGVAGGPSVGAQVIAADTGWLV